MQGNYLDKLISHMDKSFHWRTQLVLGDLKLVLDELN